MARRKTIFREDNIYHLCSRGVEKRKIFLQEKYYFRFVHDLYEFNDEAPADNLYYKTQAIQSYEARPHKHRNKRKLLVELLAFTLMPNHYHLLVRQIQENGIVRFLHKLGGGYATYFNQKYRRTGSLFEGRFKSVLVERQAHFIHLPFYIHANPLDLKFPTWRKHELAKPQEAMKFLENYRWSSFPDYIGKKNFPSVTQRQFLLQFFGGSEAYKKQTLSLLHEMDLESISEVALEKL
ncbi:MAG: transposase [Candidatus Sungiibacteriota bacterium]